MKNYFAYDNGEGVIPHDSFRISASQLSRFFTETHTWYREFLLNEEGFEGSTASHLGTIIHAIAASFIDGNYMGMDTVNKYVNGIENEGIDKKEILEQVKPMSEALINQYLRYNKPTHSEEFIYREILPGIIVGGSCDAYNEAYARVEDFKTTSQHIPKKFSKAYYMQLMTYAWIYREMGRPVESLRLIFVNRNITGRISEKTGRPLKDYPSTVHTTDHLITEEDFQIIENSIKLIADSVKMWKDRPELRYLLAQDYRLVEPRKATIFK